MKNIKVVRSITGSPIKYIKKKKQPTLNITSNTGRQWKSTTNMLKENNSIQNSWLSKKNDPSLKKSIKLKMP